MKKSFFIIIYFYSPVFLATLIFLSDPMRYGSFSRILSMLMGVCSYTWLSWQFVISARPGYIEKVVGLDRLYRFHGVMAAVSLLLALGHRIMNGIIFPDSRMIRIGNAALLIFAVISLLSAVFMVSSAIMKKQPMKLIVSIIGKIMLFRYEHLKLMHNMTVLALGLMLAHVLMTSPVRNNKMIFAGYMSYFSIALIYYLYHKFMKSWLAIGSGHEISGISKAGSGIWHIVINSGGREFSFKPGQFAFFRFPGKRAGEHPFTIASSPVNEGGISILVKELGDFTSSLSRLRKGDRVYIEGPYGRFSYLDHPSEEQLVFIAGGIGITPVLSMLEHMSWHGERRKVLLIWGIRRETDMFMIDRFEGFKDSMADFNLVPVVSDDVHYPGEKGFVDMELLDRVFYEHGIRTYKAGCYLCGPGAMMTAIKKSLVRMGTGQDLIHDERFSL